MTQIDIDHLFDGPHRISLASDGGIVIEAIDKPLGRVCGDCQLCCKLVPVLELEKPSNQRCRFQRYHKGCSVYHQPAQGFPDSCGRWSCRWLKDPETAALPRPDRAHYVIDVMLSPIHMTLSDSDSELPGSALQVWIDPAFPLAHRNPAFRTYVRMVAIRYDMPTIIRFGNDKALLLVAPWDEDGEWSERSVIMGKPRNALDQIARDVETAAGRRIPDGRS